MANNKIDYTILNEYPYKTRELLIKAFQIYANIYDKSIKIKTNKLFTRESLTPNDLKVASLFLAGIIVNPEIRDIMEQNGITKDIFEYFLGIKVNDNEYLSENDCITYFYIFKNLLNSLFASDYKNICFPEELFINLFYSSRSNSNLLAKFYLFLKKNYYDDMSRYSLEDLKRRTINQETPIIYDKDTNPKKEKSKTFLETNGKDITKMNFSINPAVGREKEIQKLIITLLTKNMSPILLGKPGVGKTAIVEGLAYAIQKDLVPKELKNKKIISIDMNTLIAGTTYRGDFEEKIRKLLKELESDPNIILYIDEFHSVIGAGRTANSSLDFANILKPYLSRGEIKIIGATTLDEYYEYISLDKAFEERFSPIEVKEPDLVTLKQIVLATIKKFEDETNISFLNDDILKNEIIDILISVTSKDFRYSEYSKCNPRLIVTIIDYIFAYAKSYNHEEVLLSDILETIENFDFLSLGAKEHLQEFLNKNNNQEEGLKILKFQKRFPNLKD